MAHTKINTQVIPDGTIVSADLTMPITGFSSTGIDDNATETAITIDSNEKLLIGNTSTGASNTGHIFQQDGLTVHRADNTIPLIIDRHNSDGDILTIRRQGAGLGGISSRGTTAGDLLLWLGSAGLTSDILSGQALLPTSNSASPSDDAVNLGSSSNRFKNLYLGGDITCGNLTSTGIDDNATSTAITIDSVGKITHTASSNITASFSSTTTTAKLTLSDTNDTAFIDVNASRLGIGHSSSTSLQALQIESTSSEAIRIKSTGRVGISTLDPNGALHVEYPYNTNPNVTVDSFQPFIVDNAGRELTMGAYSTGAFSNYLQSRGSGSAQSLAINPLGGNVGVNEDQPQTALHVNGEIRQSGTFAFPLEVRSDTFVYYPHLNTAHVAYYKRAIHPANNSEYHYYWRTSDNGTTSGANAETWMTLNTGAVHGGKLHTKNGISFSSDFSNAKTLDDYEEGTWTPAIGTGTASFSNATYTKVGRIVTVTFFFQSVSDRSASAALEISNLPFYSNSNTFATTTGLSRWINRGNGTIVAYMGGNANRVYFYALSAGADYLNVRHQDLNNASANYYATITYIAA